MQPHTETEDETEIIELLEENTALVKENNKILKRLRRNSVVELWLRVAWYAILIGLPFALYFYILGPYFDAIGIPSEKFRVGISELPGFKAFESIFGPR